MSLSDRKYKIIEQLLKVEEESTLYQIENILNRELDDIPQIVQKLIEKGIQQSEAGLGKPHEEFMVEIKKKYNFS